jgi:hypothetical protein
MMLAAAAHRLERFCAWCLLPLALAGGLGLLAAWDPVFMGEHPIRLFDINRHMPYVLSVAAVAALAALFLVAMRREALFARRDQVLLLLAIFPGAFSGFNLGILDPTDLGFAAVALLWLTLMLVEHRPLPRVNPVLLLLIGLAACSMASIVSGRFISIISQKTFLTKMAIFFFVMTMIGSPQLLRMAIRVFIGVCVFSAIVALVSEAVYLAFHYPFTMDDQLQFAFKNTPLGRMLRATAFMPRAQTLAHLLILGLALTLFFPMRAVWRWTLVGLIGAGIVATFSLGAWLITAGVLFIALFIYRPALSIHWVSLVVAAGLALYLTGAAEWLYTEVGESIGGKQSEDRIEFLGVGLRSIENHPWFGVGLKNITRVLHTPIHNAYLQTAAEMGIIAGLLFTLIPVLLFMRSGDLAARLPMSGDKRILQGLALGMFAMIVHFFVEPFYDNYMSWVFMAMAAGAIVVQERRIAAVHSPLEKSPQWRRAFGSSVPNENPESC